MKKWLLCILILVLGVIIYIIVQPGPKQLSTKDKERALEQLLGRKPILQVTPINNTWIAYKGKFMNFSYPERTTINSLELSQATKSANILEVFQFYEKSPTYFFNAEVDNQNTVTSLEDLSGVTMRENNPDLYSKKDIITSMSHGLSFQRKLPPYDKVSFFLYNNRIYTFAISGQSDSIFSIYDKILTSVSFF